MRIAIVGTQGIPNSYGGFETLAEYLVEYLSKDIDITVYCSSVDLKTRQKFYKGSNLKYIPVSSHGALGILYDSIALIQAVLLFDKVLFLGFGGGFVIPFLKKYKSKIILNIGGLDWKRNKWSHFAQRVIKKAEGFLVKNSGQIISDNIGIQEYMLETYMRKSVLITYGGDQAKKQEISSESLDKYNFLKNKYVFVVTRVQADNNVEMILDAFSNQNKIPLVIVGNWEHSGYGRKLKLKYYNAQSVLILDAIYNRAELDVLRSNCTIYIHGHSAGGTNPSLVEAMYLGLPVFAFASGYNEHTTQNQAMYFHDKDQLANFIDNYDKFNLKEMGKRLKLIAEESYLWNTIAKQYKEVLLTNNN